MPVTAISEALSGRSRLRCPLLSGWLDEDGLRVAGYIAVGLACLGVARRDQTRPQRLSPGAAWALFWYLTGALMLLLALARLADFDEFLAEAGRREARSTGWYDTRRRYQAMAVAGISAVWTVVAAVAVWRVPARRRRCLPMALVTFTIICFAAVRAISLHQIDALLYRREISGVRIVVVTELALLAAAILAVVWHPFDRRPLAVSAATRRGADATRPPASSTSR